MTRRKSVSKKLQSTSKSQSAGGSRSQSQIDRTRSPDKSKSAPRTESTINRSHRPRTKEVLVGNKTYKMNVQTLRSIKLLQMSTACCIPRLPFSRVVREIMQEVAGHRDLRVQIEALHALQEAAEIYMTTFFEDTNLAAVHARRITVRPVDMKLVERFRRNH